MALRRAKRDVEVAPPPPPHVVVLADEPGARELLVRVLRAGGDGWGVDGVRDERELLEHFTLVHATAVVIDVAAGGLGGGIRALDTVRNHHNPETAALPVVLVITSPSGALFSWQAGADELLVRPFHARELVEAVARAIARPDDERPRHRRRQIEAAKTGRVTA